MLDKLFTVGWADLFIPAHSVAEMVVRGTLMYLALFIIFRFVAHRQRSAIGISDVLVIVLIADAAQNAFAKEYRSITEGVVLVLTIILWDLFLDWLEYHWRPIGWLVRPTPVCLVRDGRFVATAMRSEMLTREELLAQAREQGILRVSQIKLAQMEPSGNISFITYEKKPERRSRKKLPGAS
ncbi:MAG TPA: YetF domain-containing protein [Burkholderiaceae bacterium]|nr:YetF domain-containing protein [Burkholderiaceae bacterium]